MGLTYFCFLSANKKLGCLCLTPRTKVCDKSDKNLGFVRSIEQRPKTLGEIDRSSDLRLCSVRM